MYNNVIKMHISNARGSVLNDNVDLFIACIGYEKRSYYLYNRIKQRISLDKMLVFCVTKSTSKNTEAVKLYSEAKKENNLVCHDVEYNNADLFQKIVVEKIKETIKQNKAAQIHIDYSSMPRSWYCKLPEKLSCFMGSESQVYFWYTEGTYAKKHYTAGIESYVLYSGIPSIEHIHRTHFIGIGFDSTRTNGIITLINPESFVCCFANNPHRTDITNKVKEINEYIMAQSTQALPLDITDIETMIAQLSGCVYQKKAAQNDVVMIPDGPKPLIFTMSMIPWLIGEPGVCCLHFKRNNSDFKPENVKPLDNNTSPDFTDTEHIIGFSITEKGNDSRYAY